MRSQEPEVRSQNAEPITEEWLRSVGFRWHEIERQPNKHWILWLILDDLGIEVTSGAYNLVRRDHSDWYCWLRSDAASRYHRFIHLRHIRYRHELEILIVALTGVAWNPANHLCGAMFSSDEAAVKAREANRLDLIFLERGHPWYESEKDPDRCRPIAEDLEIALKSGVAK